MQKMQPAPFYLHMNGYSYILQALEIPRKFSDSDDYKHNPFQVQEKYDEVTAEYDETGR